MGITICIRRVSRCVEGKPVGGFKSRRSRIWVYKGIFVRSKKKFEGEDEESVKVVELRRIE